MEDVLCLERAITGLRWIEILLLTYIQDGRQKQITGDSVIVSGGVQPNVDSALSYAGVAAKLYVIGDANGEAGVRDAYSKAMLI